MAGPLGRRPHVLGAQPDRRARATGSTPSPTGSKLYVLDMFPYPSGAGLHVGHPLGYIGTDVYARFMRMSGHNVLHAMGYDAFGLPAEQYAVQTGQHPRATTEANIANMRRQLRALGLGHDPRRGVATTDVAYYRWTQWIFLQIFNSWYDDDAGPRPADRRAGRRVRGRHARARRATPTPTTLPWADLDDDARRAVVDSYRLAYLDEAPVNWCPALGTVLANEEVTADGRSDRGNHPVFRRPLEAVDAAHHRVRRPPARRPRPARLARVDQDDAAQLDRPQRRRRRSPSRSRSTRASTSRCSRRAPTRCSAPPTWCSRPSTRCVDEIVPDRVARRLGDSPTCRSGGASSASTSCRRRRCASYREFAGAEVGARAPGRRPREDRRVHRRVRQEPHERLEHPDLRRRLRADGLRHRRDHGGARARPARLRVRATSSTCPIVGVVQPPDGWLRDRGLDADTPADEWPEAYVGDGVGMNSSNDEVSLDGLRHGRREGSAITGWLEASGAGEAAVTYKLRDWLFSRQRYWGEPFPIVYDDDGHPRRAAGVDAAGRAARDHRLRAAHPRRRRRRRCPSRRSRAPTTGCTSSSTSATARSATGARPTRCRSGPARAGTTCATSTPPTTNALVDPEVERTGWWATARRRRRRRPLRRRRRARGAAPPLRALLAQGALRPRARVDARAVPPPLQPGHDHRGRVHRRARRVRRGVGGRGARRHVASTTARRSCAATGKMGKSLKNTVAPDDIYRDYGADTLRLYEMFMGPLDASRPWSTADIVGVHRFLQRFWRNVVDEDTGELHVVDRRRPTTRRVGCCTARSTRCAHDMGDARVQHRDRARSSSSTTGSPRWSASAGSAPRRGGARDGADARAAHAARRRGAVGAARAHGRRSRSRRSPTPDPALLVDDDGRDPGAGERQGARHGHASRPAPTTPTHEAAARADERRSRSCSTARRSARSSSCPAGIVNFVVG